MTDTLIIIIVLFFVVKVVIVGPLLYVIFRDDIRQYFAERERQSREPVCPGCFSRYAEAVDDGTTRWEGNELVLVTTYECDHCHFPFWHVERIGVLASGDRSVGRDHSPVRDRSAE